MAVAKGLRRVAAGIVAISVLGCAAVALLFMQDNRASVPSTEPDRMVTGSISAVAIAPIAEARPPVAVRTPVAAPVKPKPIRPSDAFSDTLTVLEAAGEQAGFTAAGKLEAVAERHAVQWLAIQNGNGRVASSDVSRFMAEAPAFVDSALETRLEQALLRESVGGTALLDAMADRTPTSIALRIALAGAYRDTGNTDKAAEVIRAVWADDFLDSSTEANILDSYGPLLDRATHWKRAVHLMMHDRASAVERIMKYLSPAQKSLATARNAVSRNARDAKTLLDRVDPSMKSHPVFLYSRAQRARQFELWDDAIAWLDKAGGDVPDVAEFGFERRALTRQLLGLGEIKKAYAAAANYTEGAEGRVVDLQFHAGWIALAFLKDAKAAVPHFEVMAAHATLPDTITQANYWLGRANQELGNAEAAKAAYEKAAELGTVYYGQLARDALGLKSVQLRALPEAEPVEATFEAREPIRAVRLLAEHGETSQAVVLLRSFADKLEAGTDLLLAARLAEDLGSHQLAIAIADIAERRGTPLDLVNFPHDGLPATKLAAMDPAAVYAITRQESRFQVDAISSAGARGLMQLMPATAEETAGKLGVPYSKGRLTTDGEYNALLGSTYLKAQLERFDDSLVLAAAAYNAGGGNANKWIRAFGDPRSEEIDPVVWVELIPVQETRTYVKRVLGNYLVYRATLGHDDLSIVDALRKIPG